MQSAFSLRSQSQGFLTAATASSSQLSSDTGNYTSKGFFIAATSAKLRFSSARTGNFQGVLPAPRTFSLTRPPMDLSPKMLLLSSMPLALDDLHSFAKARDGSSGFELSPCHTCRDSCNTTVASARLRQLPELKRPFLSVLGTRLSIPSPYGFRPQPSSPYVGFMLGKPVRRVPSLLLVCPGSSACHLACSCLNPASPHCPTCLVHRSQHRLVGTPL